VKNFADISKWKVSPLLRVPVASTGQAKVEQLPIKIYSNLFFNACFTYMYSFFCFVAILSISQATYF